MQLFRDPMVFLWLLLAAGGVFGALIYAGRYRAGVLRKLRLTAMYSQLVTPGTEPRRRAKTILFLCALGFLFLAWAGPQWGVELKESETEIAHAVIAVDTSTSMLAQDLKPNRLENAKQMLKILISDCKGYRLGIVAFAGKAFIQCPITTDDLALGYFVEMLSTEIIPMRGTDIGSALKLTAGMLSPYPGKKALILLTDGENHETELDSAIKAAKENSIAVFAIGIGNPEGDLIPVNANGAPDYKKDSAGRTVVTKLDEKTLLKIASETGGAYTRYTGPEEVSAKLADFLKDMARSKWKGKTRVQYKNRYQLPLLMAILLLLAEMLVPEKPLAKSARKNGGRRTK
ncbi:MAG: VWA domain-containing protein [Elusimicrobiaceae bacterium]|nr:VWA domain-containing protein [Elusimicrobiaceae bacterium]